jgi:hypothetical protein
MVIKMDLKKKRRLDFKQNKMALKLNVFFRWHRDEAYEAMNDDTLNPKAQEFFNTLKDSAVKCEDIRTILHKLNEQNEMMAIQALHEFLKEDYDGLPRYVRLVQELMTYGVHENESPELNPSVFIDFVNSVKILNEDYSVEVEFTIPENFRIPDWDSDDYVIALNDFRSCLSDTLWEGMPGSLAVHKSGAVVEYVM